MIKSLLYKEWLKVRWITVAGILLFIILSLYTFLTIRSTTIQNGASSTWYKYLFIHVKFYELFKLAPIFFGLALSVFQFLPELNQKRLRLSFHLPLNQKYTLMIMVLFGELLLLIGLLISFISFTAFTSFVLPQQLISAAILSILPWGLAGIIAYNYMVIVLLEPVFIQRLFHFTVGLILLLFFIQNTVMEGLNHLLIFICILTIVSVIGALYTGNRFGKTNT